MCRSPLFGFEEAHLEALNRQRQNETTHCSIWGLRFFCRGNNSKKVSKNRVETKFPPSVGRQKFFNFSARNQHFSTLLEAQRRPSKATLSGKQGVFWRLETW